MVVGCHFTYRRGSEMHICVTWEATGINDDSLHIVAYFGFSADEQPFDEAAMSNNRDM